MCYARKMKRGTSPIDSTRTHAPEDLLSVAELAEYLAVPEKTIYAWRYRGTGPRGLRIGRHLRFRWFDVEAWLASLVE